MQHCLDRLGFIFEPAITLIAIAASLGAGCAALSVDGSRRPDSQRTDHYVVISAASEAVFHNVRCVRTLDARDIDSSADMHRYILESLQSDRHLRRCESTQPYQLLASYEAGNGVCIDCYAKRSSRSAFAILTVIDKSGQELASAEWQDWQGGSDYQVADRFVADLRRLVNGDPKREMPKLHER
jgi:hypothetical protein